jgi:hypothetical protein
MDNKKEKKKKKKREKQNQEKVFYFPSPFSREIRTKR